MKYLLKPLMLLTILATTLHVSAQKMTKKFSFGFGIEGGMPLGDLKNIYGFAGGLTVRGSYHVGPGFATLTAGSLGWFPKSFGGEDLKAGIQIPVKAGYKFIYKEHFFAMAELGYNSFKLYGIDDDGQVTSFSSSGFVFAPAIGVQLKSLELGLRYEHFSLKGGSGSFIGLRLGFNF